MVEMASKPNQSYDYPSEWKQLFVGDLVSITTGSRNTQDNNPEALFPFFVRSQKVERIDGYSFDKEAVLTAGDGVGTGKIFHYINGKFDAHQRVYILSNFVDELHGKYFYWQFINLFYDRIMSMTAKSSVDSVRREMISGMSFPLPRLKEQQAIAEALSDADSLIASLEKLIEKKQNVLFQFHNYLFDNTPISAEVTLNSLGDFYGGLTGKTAVDFGVGLSSFVNFKSVIDYHEVNVADVSRVYISRFEIQNLVKKGDLLFNISSETPDEVAQFSIVPFEKPDLYLNSFCAGFRCHQRQYDFAKLLNYLLQTNVIRSSIIQLAQGSTRYNLSPRLLGSIIVPLPDKNIMATIVHSLDDFYNEIKLLSENLIKAKKVKAGMMQELLMGRTRLI